LKIHGLLKLLYVLLII